ncbi:MAG: RIP metalloprotease RseP [Peptococcaceae bacterium]|jgi:regulator of sigma E protease|nr:RIP metalloprotease RseP [Peptococcaceae bacterium]
MLINMLTQAIAVICVLGVITLIHEWGHYVSARSVGVAVQEFSIGLGPALWKKRGKETLFSLRCIPFGGYCLFDPETEKVDAKGRPASLLRRNALTKMYILAAGPVMNFVLAAALFALLFAVIGVGVGFEPVIGQVQPDSPAAAAGILPGDRVLAIAGEPLASWEDLSRIVTERQDEGALDFLLSRQGREIALTVTPRYDPDAGRILIGVTVDTAGEIRSKSNPLRGIWLGLLQTVNMIGVLLGALTQMATGQISAADNVSGPVALVRVIGETASSGLWNTLWLTAFLSVNLGIMNLLPIPALDGGKILVCLVELIRRKPLSLEVEGWINMVGFVLLISLMIFLTARDIFQVAGS